MDKFIVTGGNPLNGTISVSGAKNAALKALVAACLTTEEVVIRNVPLISDFFLMVDIMKFLGAAITIRDHTVKIRMKRFHRSIIPLDKAVHARTSAMFIGPLLARTRKARIPNPGGCRLGARPIDRTIEGIKHLNTKITYNSEDGYFYAETRKLKAATYTFEKNTHVGTETMIIAAALAEGTTVLKNAAEEPEIDDLIGLLNTMGAQVQRSGKREITIVGVEKLHGGTHTIHPDRNEIVTFAIAAILTGGDIFIKDAHLVDLQAFLEALKKAGGGYEVKADGVRFYSKGKLQATDITTQVYPGFMTDWQAPWAVLMTQADGTSIIHETVFEDKFGYVPDLRKMGAHVQPYHLAVKNPETVYNFNLSDDRPEFFHAIKIIGPTKLHNAIVTTLDIRAGAAVVLAALAAKGTSTIFGSEKLDRGYEKFEKRLTSLGAKVRRVNKP
jgi:UDP-N-acetylglucosamine 1-carboxyvinyltransferase